MLADKPGFSNAPHTAWPAHTDTDTHTHSHLLNIYYFYVLRLSFYVYVSAVVRSTAQGLALLHTAGLPLLLSLPLSLSLYLSFSDYSLTWLIDRFYLYFVAASK